MTRLWNQPDDFASEMLDGFTQASARWVRKVFGGVTRSTRDEPPTVALVIGGGSGHYPTFGGLVGPGLAHGAAMGNLFASPSARQAESVIRASDQGRGVIVSFGNYAGDVLHFGTAQDAVRADGIDCRIVLVTDDIFSAPPSQFEKRRGIAGDLVVFKVAGAAAAAGHDLDKVEALARHANARTRSMGVAFTGCTLPGAEKPLFSVPEGRMAIGLGIHGEPGIDEVNIPTADGLAELFIERLLDEHEIPEGVDLGGARVVPILNGLGSVKTEELFIVYKRVAELLHERGITPLDPHIGEYCTSFDMAGASLSLLWVDEELEELWLAPADTPAYRTSSQPLLDPTGFQEDLTAFASVPPATDISRELASRVSDAFQSISAIISSHAEELGEIDSIAGDGDHGIGMKRGAAAAAQGAASAVAAGAGAGTTLTLAGDAWSDVGGGTSGALWGVMLKQLGTAFGDDVLPSDRAVSDAVSSAIAEVQRYGGAQPGDKTMVDAILPFASTLSRQIASGSSLPVALAAASDAAAAAAAATADLLPKLGRARSHGEKSLGTPDPGAISFAIITNEIASQLASAERN